MKSITFFVPGLPVAKGYGFTKGGIQFKKPNAKRWERSVALAAFAAAEAGWKPYEGFVQLAFLFSFPIPASRIKKIAFGDLHGQDPDLTNLIKSTEDAMKRILFVDDNRVLLGESSKIWTDAGKEGAEIVVGFL